MPAQARPAALNAANEVAVGAFLDRRIGFLDIAATVAETIEQLNGTGDLTPADGDRTLEWALMIDAGARRVAAQVLSRLGRMA